MHSNSYAPYKQRPARITCSVDVFMLLFLLLSIEQLAIGAVALAFEFIK